MISRIGGVLIHPRETLDELLAGEGGSVFDILPWCVVVACVLSPSRAGQVVLFMRVDVLEGLRILASLVSSQMMRPLVGVLVAALLLAMIARFTKAGSDSSGERITWTFDRCLDACMYMLVPYLLITSVSVIVEQLGVRGSFFPHRPFRGRGVYLFIRLALAFGWSFCLYFYVLKKLWSGSEPEIVEGA